MSKEVEGRQSGAGVFSRHGVTLQHWDLWCATDWICESKKNYVA